MNPKGLNVYPSAAVALDSGLPLFKVLLGLTGICVLLFLLELGVLPSLPLSTLSLTIASAGFMLVRGRGNADLLHPVRVFGALWCFCLALGTMHLLPAISDWSNLMWRCVLTALASFVGGFWLAKRLSNSGRISVNGSTVVTVPAEKTLILAALCLAVGIAVLIYEFHLIGGIPILSDNVDGARTKLFGFGGDIDPEFNKLYIKLIHPLSYFLRYGVFLAVIALCQRTRKSRKLIVIAAVLIILGAGALGSQAGRGFFVDPAITSLALFHYVRRRVRLIELSAGFLAMFLFLGLFGSLRVKESESAPFFQRALSTSKLPEGEFWDGITFGYGTLTYSLEVFNRLIEDLPTIQRPSGGYLLYALHRFIPRANIQVLAFDLYSGEMITPTFLGEFYADYGYWGVLFGPLLLGAFYGWAYSQGNGQNEMYWIYVRAMLVQMLIYFPYWNQFSYTLTWVFDLFFMYLLIRLLRIGKMSRLQPGTAEDSRIYQGSPFGSIGGNVAI
jgi:oligosaccharide repeat unit polymerase